MAIPYSRGIILTVFLRSFHGAPGTRLRGKIHAETVRSASASAAPAARARMAVNVVFILPKIMRSPGDLSTWLNEQTYPPFSFLRDAKSHGQADLERGRCLNGQKRNGWTFFFARVRRNHENHSAAGLPCGRHRGRPSRSSLVTARHSRASGRDGSTSRPQSVPSPPPLPPSGRAMGASQPEQSPSNHPTVKLPNCVMPKLPNCVMPKRTKQNMGISLSKQTYSPV